MTQQVIFLNDRSTITSSEYAYQLVLEYWDIIGMNNPEISHYKAKSCAKKSVNQILNIIDKDEPDHEKLYSFLEEVLIEIDKL